MTPPNEPVKPATDMTGALAAAEMRARLALATAGAILVAGVILMIAILPAEYRVNPLGTGKLLGLTSIAQAESAGEGESAAVGELGD